jgi:hypothetical protein
MFTSFRPPPAADAIAAFGYTLLKEPSAPGRALLASVTLD